MKERLGFVSNSSSASFIVKKSNLSQLQYDMLMNPKYYINTTIKDMYIQELDEDEVFDQDLFESWCQSRFGWVEDITGWEKWENENEIRFFTIIDNFQYGDYLDLMGIPNEYHGD